MVGVVFFFEDNDKDVYSGRHIDLDAWYLSTQVCSDVDKMILINLTDQLIRTPNADFDFTVCSGLPPLENAIYLCPHGEQTLYDIDHSKVDWYVFGPASGWREDVGPKVSLPSCEHVHLHSQHVMTAVMYDRYRNVEWQLH